MLKLEKTFAKTTPSQMGMKYLSKSLLKRWSALTAVVAIFGVSVLSVVVSVIAAQPVKAQSAYTWVNVGTITNGAETFYDKNPYDNIREFGLYGAKLCDYPAANPPISNLPYDRLVVQNNSSATRYVIDANIVDGFQKIKCEAKATNITLTNTSKSSVVMYRKGDTVSTYNNTQSFNKLAGSGPNELFVRSGESGTECADLIVHGTSGDYNGWFIFPMGPKDYVKQNEPGTAVSERYAGLVGVDSSKERCRVASAEIETVFKLDVRIPSGRTPCDPTQDPSCGGTGNMPWDAYELTGIDQNIFAYPNHTIPGGWGDDGYLMKNGVGDESSAPPANAPPPNDADNATGTPTPNTCDVAFSVVDIFSLKWIVCPVLDGLFGVVALVDDLLNSQLKLDLAPLNDGTPYHLAWNAFRVLALGIIVIAALIMVVAQATGIELFSAYTARKLAGYFIVAVILIPLSWPLSKVIFASINEISDGVKFIMLMPFGSFPAEQLSGGSSFSLALLGTGAVLFLGPLGLLSLAGTFAVTVASALFLLGLMHALTYMLIISAPAWIALALLPGTRPGFKFASSLYTVCAMLTLIIVAIVNGMRGISIGIYHLGGTVNELTGLVIYIISAGIVTVIIVKFSGGATAIITGVGDKFSAVSRGFSKFRSGQVKKNIGKMADGERFGRNYLGFNSATRGMAAFWNADKKGAFFSPDYETRRMARQNALLDHDSRRSNAWAKSEESQSTRHNDDANQAQAAGDTEAEARRNLRTIWGFNNEQIEQKVRAAKGQFSRARRLTALDRLAESGTGFDDGTQMHEAVHAMAGNNTTLGLDTLYRLNQITKGNRTDMAYGAGMQKKVYERRLAKGSKLDESEIHDAEVEAIKEADPMALGRMKGKGVERAGRAAAREINILRDVVHNNDGTVTVQEQENARSELVKMTGLVEAAKQQAGYFSANNTERMASTMGVASAQIRSETQEAINQLSQPNIVERIVIPQPTQVVAPPPIPAQPTVIVTAPSGATQSMSGSLGGPAPAPAPAPIPAPAPAPTPVPVMAGGGGAAVRPVVAYHDAAGNPVYEPNPNYNPEHPLIEKNQWHNPASRMPYNRDVHEPKP